MLREEGMVITTDIKEAARLVLAGGILAVEVDRVGKQLEKIGILPETTEVKCWVVIIPN